MFFLSVLLFIFIKVLQLICFFYRYKCAHYLSHMAAILNFLDTKSNVFGTTFLYTQKATKLIFFTYCFLIAKILRAIFIQKRNFCMFEKSHYFNSHNNLCKCPKYPLINLFTFVPVTIQRLNCVVHLLNVKTIKKLVEKINAQLSSALK